MKTFLLLICVSIISMVYNINAQDNDSRNLIKIGAKIGANYSNVYDSEGEEFNADGKLGLVLGGYMEIPFGPYFGFHPELLFSQKGFQGTGKVIGFNYSFTRTTSFIDIPLLFALKPNQFMTILIGPQYSYLIKQSDSFESELYKQEIEQEFKNDDIQDNILGFIFGLDVHLNNFQIGGRVGMDFMNNKADGESTTPRYKNVWGQLTLGIDLLPLF